MSEPLSHIQRTPLPWRESALTECGRPIAEMALVITVDEARRRAAEMGKQRFSLFHCMTCTHTVGSWPSWESDPLGRLSRESRGDLDLVTKELRAIAALIEAHRDEFDAFVEGLDQTVNLSDRRKGMVS